ncbi:esterase/lipase family protein [Streptomyces sp. NBC_01589]|uniref:esterase/lipase family protein n=1 Tax=unclassified Streptomyces TaxID=2593676 RepID=UPI003868C30F
MATRSLSALLAGLTLTFGSLQPTAHADSGPALGTPVATLDAAVSCSANYLTAAKHPILLVHGIAVSSDTNWNSNDKHCQYRGYPVCWVEPPNLELGDIQESAEYIVNAIRKIYNDTGKPVDVIGYSEGSLLTTWALRFRPDLAGKTKRFISIAGVLSDTVPANLSCFSFCVPAGHQMAVGSQVMQAMARHPLPPGPAYLSIASLTDEFNNPQPQASTFAGMTVVTVQQVCPGRVVGRVTVPVDAAVECGSTPPSSSPPGFPRRPTSRTPTAA